MAVSFDRRLFLLVVASGLPAAALALTLLWTGDFTLRLQWTLTVLLFAIWMGCAFAARRRVVVPLHTLANMLAALRERDFSIRARGAVTADPADDPLGAVFREVNDLATTLHDQRLGAIEASALLQTVMVEIDVAVFTFDSVNRLRLVNRAGEQVLGRPADQLLDLDAESLGLAACLDGTTPRIETIAFPGATARWEVRRTTFRQDGRPHQLLVLADISRPLRDEERQAWQRLIRVIGHEINNSLAPIKSIAGSLESMLGRVDTSGNGRGIGELASDMRRGLTVIAGRADALGRFTTAYASLAKLPEPRRSVVNIEDLVRRAVALETRLPVRITGQTSVTLRADGDQIEQLLINVIRNAADAALETGGGVTVDWRTEGRAVALTIDDEGAGTGNVSNLFVPFFTTKPGGSGIGLVLSRQIAEAHGGTLTLENRTDRTGCRAHLRLPL